MSAPATGRGLPELASGLPGALICGIEPVAGLLRQAVDSGVQRSAALVNGTGELLPFMDESFDAVCEISMLHHVPNPTAVVREMMRVASKMVIISDSTVLVKAPYPRVGSNSFFTR